MRRLTPVTRPASLRMPPVPAHATERARPVPIPRPMSHAAWLPAPGAPTSQPGPVVTVFATLPLHSPTRTGIPARPQLVPVAAHTQPAAAPASIPRPTRRTAAPARTIAWGERAAPACVKRRSSRRPLAICTSLESTAVSMGMCTNRATAPTPTKSARLPKTELACPWTLEAGQPSTWAL